MNEVGLLNNEALNQLIVVKKNVKLNASEVKSLQEMFRYYAQHSSLFSKFSDNSKLPDSICQRTTGFNRQQFEELSGDLISLRNTSSRSKSQVLAIFLFWLKTGLDQYTVADYFDIDSF